MKIIWGILLMKMILLASSCGLPTYDIQPRSSLITSPCTSNNGCWGWLPTTTRRGENNRFQEAENYRLQNHLNISTFERNINAEQDHSQGNGKSLVAMDMRTASPVIRQMSNKPVKKDVFMSRSWGAGGMPFSVLYMNTHETRLSHPLTSDTSKTSNESFKKSVDVPLASSKQPNTRVAVRNGTLQPRRQYSVIPQLFISYGWGPFGK
ncbi:uncharacterized protein LOC107044716 isoform X2 [Diachasma alloeum]|uniref:uncharacterized protein LOC107044716 isoform X2 n=1 Tax=Diachasma alloeum TaxID=454923 RepID=UPI000738100E|nr:uncharacterized protein LOC107044716 isoform X2 [Diachasma alloeum]